MVLHSFMLNPRNYLSDCIRYGKMELWAAGMPWSAVNAVIDNETFAYRPGGLAQKAFEAATGAPWDNLHEPPHTSVKCQKCKTSVHVPWTTCEAPSRTQDPSKILEKGEGYADADFWIFCKCGLRISHDYLRSAKFVRDVQKVMVQSIPMPGGYLSTKGSLT